MNEFPADFNTKNMNNAIATYQKKYRKEQKEKLARYREEIVKLAKQAAGNGRKYFITPEICVPKEFQLKLAKELNERFATVEYKIYGYDGHSTFTPPDKDETIDYTFPYDVKFRVTF